MKDLVLTTLTRDELQALVIDSVKVCLKHHTAQTPVPRDDTPTEAGQAFVSKKQAARLLDCSVSSVDNFARAGRLTRHYVGGKSVRFDRQQVLALAQKRTNHKQKGNGK